ncbi:ADP-ribosylglycohydrolase family protein [Candidatus Riflebacteria bacterium]
MVENELFSRKKRAITGCLLGTAVGDALGLPFEGLTKARIIKLEPDFYAYSFLGNLGFCSDDTEHSCMVAQALIAARGDLNTFKSNLSWRLRFWLLSIPAGIGLATLRGIVNLWLGFSPDNSGVFSAGNGPAMRSTILGVVYGNEKDTFLNYIRANTRLTHSDPKAFFAAVAAGFAAFLSSERELISPDYYFEELATLLHKEDWSEFTQIIEKMVESLNKDESTEEYAQKMGLEKGITGYSYHTVPVVLHCWLRNQDDFATALKNVIRLGGDTDTTAAILGGIIGASCGKEGIPHKWLQNLAEWPCTVRWMEGLASSLSLAIFEKKDLKPPNLFFPWILLRNFIFLCIVLFHGLRRLLPPY